jgi:hypothetical protein
MTRKRLVIIIVSAVLFYFASGAQAEMSRVVFNGWTQNFSDPDQQRVALYIEVYDTVYSHPPDFVATISVKAPDGTILTIDPLKDWSTPDQGYWKPFYAGQFDSLAIPSGKYTVTVTPVSGASIKESDTIEAAFLPLSSITYPSNNEVNVTATPTLTWAEAVGAAHYRLLLWDNSWDEPIYWYFNPARNFHTEFTQHTIPKGVFKPNHQYRLRIQARANSQDTDARSESDWVTFTTGSW